ncbi:MAG: peptidylprolyl isomerase [Bacillota bacterium]
MNNEILATVGQRSISREDLNMAIQMAPKEQAAQINTYSGRKYLLSELITQEMFYQDAVEKELYHDEDFIKQLDMIKENLLKQYAVQALFKNVQVTDEESKKYYQENPEQFLTKDSVRAKHILVKEEDKAKEIAAEIKAGKSFEEAAKAYSECPSKANGGDLGYFEKGQMVPEFEKAAFEAEPGAISEPVKTQFGYHIIRVEDKKPSANMEYDQIADQLKNYLLRNKQNQLFNEYAEQLKQKYEVHVNDELLK